MIHCCGHLRVWWVFFCPIEGRNKLSAGRTKLFRRPEQGRTEGRTKLFRRADQDRTEGWTTLFRRAEQSRTEGRTTLFRRAEQDRTEGRTTSFRMAEQSRTEGRSNIFRFNFASALGLVPGVSARRRGPMFEGCSWEDLARSSGCYCLHSGVCVALCLGVSFGSCCCRWLCVLLM